MKEKVRSSILRNGSIKAPMTEEETQTKIFLEHSLQHSENVFNSRINYFIVAESILATALFQNSPSYPRLLFVGATAVTIVWLVIDIQSFVRLGRMGDRLEKLSPDYKDLRGNKSWLFSNNFLSGILLPMCFLLAWLILLSFNISNIMFSTFFNVLFANLGLVFNFLGTLLAAFAFGKLPKGFGGSTETDGGKKYNFAYLTHPNFFYLGIVLLLLGFLLQVHF